MDSASALEASVCVESGENILPIRLHVGHINRCDVFSMIRDIHKAIYYMHREALPTLK